MTRNEILSAAMLRPRHPHFLPLTYGRFVIINKLKRRLAESGCDDPQIGNAVSWVVCTRPADDADMAKAIGSEDIVEAFRPLWEDKLHVSDMIQFMEWFDNEFREVDAAATVHKPEARRGKSDAPLEPTPTT